MGDTTAANPALQEAAMRDTKTQDDSETAIDRLASTPMNRRRLVIAGGGVAASAALLAACGDDDDESTASSSSPSDDSSTATSDDSALAQFGKGDLGILNYALTLELIESDFYRQVARSGLFKGDDLALIRSFGADEQAHVDVLTATVEKLGGKPAPKPKTSFPLEDAKSVLELAATVENLGSAAYLGQAARIENGDVLAAALSIHSVEARHAATLNTLIDESFVPEGAFAKPADAQTVLDKVQPFLAG
jgi:rubrerythrin